jgi:hypothetical protein
VDSHGIDKYLRKRFGCGRSGIKYSRNKIDNEIDPIEESFNMNKKEKNCRPQK